MAHATQQQQTHQLQRRQRQRSGSDCQFIAANWTSQIAGWCVAADRPL